MTVASPASVTNVTVANYTNLPVGSYDLLHFTSTTANSSNFNLLPATIFGGSLNLTSTDLYLVISAVPLTFDPTGASYTWDAASTNWQKSGVAASWVNGPVSQAQFTNQENSGITTVALSGALTAGQVKFDTTGAGGKAYTLTGPGSLSIDAGGMVANSSATINADVTLTASQNWSVATGKTLAIGGNLGGFYYLTKIGAGTLDLTNAPSGNYGGLIVSGGTVIVNSAGQLGLTPDVPISGGVTVQLAYGFAEDFHNFAIGTGGGVLNISKSAGGQDPNVTFDVNLGTGDITGTGALTKDGNGTLLLGVPDFTGISQPSYKGGTVYINAGTIKITATNDVGASYLASANINVNNSASGSGLTPSGAVLQLGDDSTGTGITLGSATVAGAVGYIDLYDGATLAAAGTTVVTHAVTYSSATVLTSSISAYTGTATKTNNVSLTALAGAKLTLGSNVGQFGSYSGPSDAVIHITGPGTVVLAYGAAPGNASDYMYAGDWSVEGGTLEIDQAGTAFYGLLSLGYQNGDPTTAGLSTISVSGTGVLRLATNTDPTHGNALAALPTAVMFSGGSIAGTGTGLGSNGARFGGNFTVASAGGSVLTYDPAHPAAAENVALVGAGAADWQGTLTVDQGTGGASGGKFIIASAGTATVAAGAQVTVPGNSTVELQGTTALYDTSVQCGVAFAVSGKLNVTAGANQVGAVSGSGTVSVTGTGTSLTADSVTGNPLAVSGGGVLSLSQKTQPGSAVSEIPLPSVAAASKLYVTDNPLIVQGSSVTAVSSLISGGELATLSSANAPALTALSGTQFHNVLGPSATLDGAAVNATDVLVLWKTDINMDGIVDLPDLLWLDYAYLGGTTSFATDLTGDGKVNAADYAVMYAALNAEGSTQLANQAYADGLARFGEAFQLAVPEPGSLGLLGMAALGLLRGRRR